MKKKTTKQTATEYTTFILCDKRQRAESIAKFYKLKPRSWTFLRDVSQLEGILAVNLYCDDSIMFRRDLPNISSTLARIPKLAVNGRPI